MALLGVGAVCPEGSFQAWRLREEGEKGKNENGIDFHVPEERESGELPASSEEGACCQGGPDAGCGPGSPRGPG